MKQKEERLCTVTKLYLYLFGCNVTFLTKVTWGVLSRKYSGASHNECLIQRWIHTTMAFHEKFAASHNNVSCGEFSHNDVPFHSCKSALNCLKSDRQWLSMEKTKNHQKLRTPQNNTKLSLHTFHKLDYRCQAFKTGFKQFKALLQERKGTSAVSYTHLTLPTKA